MVERTAEFENAAKPLAEYLSQFHVNDPIHTFTLADLYDMVNEIRDDRIKKATQHIKSLTSSDDFYFNPQKKSWVVKLQGLIRFNQGISNG